MEQKKPVPKKNSGIVLPKWFFLYATASVTIAISIFYSSYFLLTDNDPPSLPLSIKTQPIDCNSIVSHAFSYSGSKITFNVTIGKFIQYPKSAAAGLLRVLARTGRVFADYSVKNFWDAESDLHELSFSVLHPFTGDTAIDLMCSKIPLMSKNLTIDELTVYPVGWSRFHSKEFTVMEAFEVCWQNGTIIFSSAAPVKFNPFIVGPNVTLVPNISTLPMKMYASNFKSKYIHQNKDVMYGPDVLFLGENPKKGYEKIVNLLIPIVTHTYFSKENIKHTLVLTRDQIEQMPLIGSVFSGEIIDSNTNLCFNNGIILPSTNSVKQLVNQSLYTEKPHLAGLDHMEYVTRIKPEIMHVLRDKIPSKSQMKHTIVVDSSSDSIIPVLRKLYPEAEINQINDDDDIFIIANIVSKSSIFVGSNIMYLAYSVFLQEGATIVEVIPEGQECIQAGKRWAAVTGLNYVPLGREADNSVCTSKTFEDYYLSLKNSTYPSLLVNYIKDVFDPLMA
jgi:hypothetical protein